MDTDIGRNKCVALSLLLEIPFPILKTIIPLYIAYWTDSNKQLYKSHCEKDTRVLSAVRRRFFP